MTTHSGVAASTIASEDLWRITVEEYEFMRDTMGRNHQEACHLVGTTVDAFGAQARRHGYTYRP